MRLNKKINLYLLFATLVPFFIYFLTFPRENGLVDSGLMATAAVELGIPLPTGFPSYLIIANLFSRIPLINQTVLLYFVSIISSCLTLVIVYQLITTLTKSLFKEFINLAALVATISLAFSYQFWSSAINIETFPLTNLFIVLQLFMLIKIRENIIKTDYKINKKTKHLILIFFALFGFSLGLNPIIIFILGAILGFIFYFRQVIKERYKIFLVGCFVSFMVFVATYAYLPIRALNNPYLNFGDPKNLASILSVMTGKGFITKVSGTNALEVIGLNFNPQVIQQSATNFFNMLLYQFNPLILIFFVFGLWVLIKRRSLLIMILSIFLSGALLGIFYISGNQENWFLVNWIIIAIGSGLGLGFFLNHKYVNGIFKKYPLVVVLIFIISLAPLFFWFPRLNRSQNDITSSYIKNLYYGVDKNAVVLGWGNIFEGQTAYAKIVKKYRRDIFPIAGNFYYDFSWYRNNIYNSEKIITSSKQKALIFSTSKENQEPIIYQLVKDNPGKIFYIDKNYVDAYLPSVLLNCINICSLREYFLIPHGMLYKISKSKDDNSFNQTGFLSQIKNTKDPNNYFYLELLTKNQLAAISYMYQGQLNQKISDNSLHFELPSDWSVTKNEEKLIIQNANKNFVIEISEYLNINIDNPNAFILDDNSSYGKLIDEGLASIPKTKYAYVKIWQDKNIQKNQFYLLYDSIAIRATVWPSDSDNMKVFDSIISSIKFR